MILPPQKKTVQATEKEQTNVVIVFFISVLTVSGLLTPSYLANYTAVYQSLIKILNFLEFAV